MSRQDRSGRRRFLKAIVGGALGAAAFARFGHEAAAHSVAKCGVPCAYCYGTCQVDYGHSGNHVCQNLHTWYGPTRRVR